MASDDSSPGVLDAILQLHSFTEAGLSRLERKIDEKIDHLDTKIETLRYDMNRRFDRVEGRFAD